MFVIFREYQSMPGLTSRLVYVQPAKVCAIEASVVGGCRLLLDGGHYITIEELPTQARDQLVAALAELRHE